MMEISLKNLLETGTKCVENPVIQFPNTSEVPTTVIALLHIRAHSSRIRFMLSPCNHNSFSYVTTLKKRASLI